ncbi:MAG TPA: CYTH domain-containing protein, partial [Deinococcales bacterium]|nr:CYTH domain-containing protein [Deinococcales bacterium]
MDDRERELKFTLLGDPPDLEGLPALAGRALRFDRLEDQENTYLDTPDRRLSAAGHALRVRRADGRAVVTLKGPSRAAGGSYDRMELEAPLPGPDSGVEDLPDGRLRDEVTVLAGGEPLEPLARLRTARKVWRLDGVGELSLDAVRVLSLPPAGGEDSLAEFEELELEARDPGGADRLDALAETLRGLAAMTPSTTGKLGRALAAYAPRPAASTAWAVLAAETLARELERLQAFLPVAQADRTPEGVHGLRVSCRRLRAALSLFREAWPAGGPAWRDLSVGLRHLGRALGEVRDLDVLLERLDGDAAV